LGIHFGSCQDTDPKRKNIADKWGAHFCQMERGEVDSVVSGKDGLAKLEATLAILTTAENICQ